MMNMNDMFDQMNHKLNALFPESLQQLKDETQQNVKRVVLDSFKKMDLVTREEFDIQCRVLEKTREKVEQLSEQVSALEQQLGVNQNGDTTE